MDSNKTISFDYSQVDSNTTILFEGTERIDDLDFCKVKILSLCSGTLVSFVSLGNDSYICIIKRSDDLDSVSI